MIINKRNVLIFGASYNYTISRLKTFKNEFNEYIDKFNENKIFLKNGITIQAITINDKKFYSNNYTQINADYFLEVCYRIAYYNNKKEIKEINNKTTNLQEENEKLKKQLAEKNIEYFKGAYDTYHKCYDQQQEFINYITSYIELLNDKPDLIEEGEKDILEEILQKYKEIIGDSDE